MSENEINGNEISESSEQTEQLNEYPVNTNLYPEKKSSIGKILKICGLVFIGLFVVIGIIAVVNVSILSYKSDNGIDYLIYNLSVPLFNALLGIVAGLITFGIGELVNLKQNEQKGCN